MLLYKKKERKKKKKKKQKHNTTPKAALCMYSQHVETNFCHIQYILDVQLSCTSFNSIRQLLRSYFIMHRNNFDQLKQHTTDMYTQNIHPHFHTCPHSKNLIFLLLASGTHKHVRIHILYINIHLYVPARGFFSL